MQFLGPALKGCIESNLSLLYRESPKNRSGLKSQGSVQNCGSWLIAHCQTLTMVPAGTNLPATIAPPFGANLGKPPAKGGYMRRDSSRHASMYERSPTELNVMSLSSLNEERTSWVSLASLSSFVVSRKTAPDKRVAVVSEPARISLEALTEIWSMGSC